MDFRNASIPSDIINMMDVNKAIQRCTVKAIALHGLGLYIYAGEDLPEEQKPIISESQYDATLLSKNKKHVDYFLNNFEMTDEQKIKFQEIKDAE